MNGLRSATRPVMTIMVAVTICAGFLVGRIDAVAFLPIGLLVLNWWFRDREDRGGK